MKGYIVYADYETIENETIIQLFGRLENGQSFVTLNKFEPYFFITKKEAKIFSSILKQCKVEETKLKNFEGEEVTKISFQTRANLTKLHEKIHKTIQTYEADLKPQYKFLMDKDILGCIEIQGDYESAERIDRVYKEPSVKPIKFYPKVKIISIDTESEKNSGKLLCIGLYSQNYKKNFMITTHKLEKTVSCSSESECLEKFKEELIKLDPDIITGWNIIDFDFLYLKELFKKNKIVFDLGRTNDEARLRIEKNFFRASSMDIPGRQVLDGINLIKDPFIKEAPSIKNLKFESFSLEDVSQAILEKGKIFKGIERHDELERLYEENTSKSHQKIVDYNLMDCELVFDILKKTEIIELALERSQLTGMSLDRLTGSIVAFDSLYIREARERGFVSPTTEFKEKKTRIKGGFVQSLKSGIYKNVLVLDFKSLYPSIIRTFNIDPFSYLENPEKEKNIIETPNKAYFKNQDGILPSIIEKLWQEREKAKKEKRELSSYAIKTIMNSFFGVLASPNCRYFNLKMANAITHFGQFIIKLAAKEIEKKGYKVIYSDTDSVFVETNLGKEKANSLGEEIQEQINNFYKDYVKKNYKRESFLELEFEKQYLSLMIPKIRTKETENETAAKKRYAGLIEKNGKEKIEIIGLEAIRGDWTEAAQEFQVELLNKLFHNEPVEKFIKEYIKKIREGKLNNKLIYRKSIRKNLEEYTKTTPPHVKAARKLEKLESNVIEYYITLDGPEPIQKLKHKIDYEHYIEKQIKPIANQILSLFDKNFDDLAQKSKQAKLF
ncbi:DNA polymerase II [Candidatus Pacearchaeota archaeon]|nr:DNA polymerase II [Candidatus Pacearchaeota archaeon]